MHWSILRLSWVEGFSILSGSSETENWWNILLPEYYASFLGTYPLKIDNYFIDRSLSIVYTRTNALLHTNEHFVSLHWYPTLHHIHIWLLRFSVWCHFVSIQVNDGRKNKKWKTSKVYCGLQIKDLLQVIVKGI